MSKRKKLLTKNVLCAVMAASVVVSGSTVFAHAPWENEMYWDNDKEANVIDNFTFSTEDMGDSSFGINGTGVKYIINNPTVLNGEFGPDDGATVIINGGSINADYFNTENGTLVVNDAQITSPDIHAGYLSKGEGYTKGTSIIEINNSNISPQGNSLIASGIDSTISLNGSEDNIYRVGNFIGGAAEDANGTNGGKVEITGGTLIADNLRAITNGSLLTTDMTGLSGSQLNDFRNRITKGGVVLKDNGVIQTKTGQIYEHGIDTTNDETVLASTDSGKVTNDYISYEGGTINFTDEKYTQSYLDSAIANMAEKGSTNINMLGTMIGEQGEVIENITIDEAVANGNIQTNAIVNTNDNITKLVVGNGITDTDTQYSNGSFTAAKLAVDEKTSDIEITDGKTLGLGGQNGGELIVGNAGELNITVNHADSKLTLGRTGLNADNNLTANVTVNSGTVEAVSGATTVNGDINVNVDGTLNINGNAVLTANKTLTAQQGANINIGDENSAGTLKAKNVQLNGATVYLDPVWKDGQTIGDASKAGLIFAENAGIDGNLIVGENSVLTLGSTDTNSAEKIFVKTNVAWGNGENDVLSAVYVASPQDISNGSLLVDKTAAGTEVLQNGEVNFGKNSILIVDGKNLNEDEAAIEGVTSAQIAQNEADKQNGAKLYIDNAQVGKNYTILDLKDGTEQWNNDNVTSSNPLMIFEGNKKSEEDPLIRYSVTGYKNVEDVLGNNVVSANVVNKTLQAGVQSGNINDRAFMFFNKATDNNYNQSNEAKITALNSVANMGELAGVNHGAYSMSNTMTDAIADHLSLANHGEQDNDIWARYIHSEEDIEDMELGGINADYDATYNGIIVGGDFYKNGKGTVGLAVAYADGDIDGSNMAARTENDAEYYGASLYGRIDNGDSALLGDISFLHSSNDITQYNSDEKITASPDADAFSIGLRAEKEIKAGNGKLVPYAGVRYMHMGAGDYTNSLGMKYDADEQNLFLLPVGLKYTAEIKHNDWTIKPMAEVGYVWNFGDKNTDQTISLNGASNTFGFDTVDDGVFVGRLGIEAENDKMAYGIGYEYQDGDSSSSDKWMANVTFKF